MPQATSAADITYFTSLEDMLDTAKSNTSLHQTIVDAPFHDKLEVTQLGLGIIVLLLVNKAKQTIDRVALSDTYHAVGAVKASEKTFRSIKIPLHHKKNLIAKVINSNEHQATNDWQYLFTPSLTKEQARYNQDGADIQHSEVWPLTAGDGGALIFSFYRFSDSAERNDFMRRYSQLVTEHLS